MRFNLLSPLLCLMALSRDLRMVATRSRVERMIGEEANIFP